MGLTWWERAGGLLLLVGLAFLIALRPLLRVVVREAAPKVAVRVQALRNELDPWGRPFVAPGVTTVPGTQISVRWTGPTYSMGPDGVDDTGSSRAPAELWFEEFRFGSTTNVTRITCTEAPRPFDDRRNDDPAPAWDGHCRPLMVGDDVFVAWGSTPIVRLLAHSFELELAILCFAVGWVLLLVEEGAPRREARRLPDRLRRLGLAAPPVALAGWVGVELASAPELRGLVHPLVPAPVALGGSAALVALLLAAGLYARVARREAATREPASGPPSR